MTCFESFVKVREQRLDKHVYLKHCLVSLNQRFSLSLSLFAYSFLLFFLFLLFPLSSLSLFLSFLFFSFRSLSFSVKLFEESLSKETVPSGLIYMNEQRRWSDLEEAEKWRKKREWRRWVRKLRAFFPLSFKTRYSMHLQNPTLTNSPSFPLLSKPTLCSFLSNSKPTLFPTQVEVLRRDEERWAGHHVMRRLFLRGLKFFFRFEWCSKWWVR